MKKKLVCLVIIGMLIVAPFLHSEVLETRAAEYAGLVVSAAGAETDLVAATGFNIGIPAPGTTALAPKDLQILFGSGSAIFGGKIFANALELICYATASENNTAEMSLYSVSASGPPLKIAGLVYIFGTAIRSTGVRWADTCTVTDTHPKTVAASDSGNNRVVKVVFDNIGYRNLYMIVHGTATGAATDITVQMRPF